MSEVKSTIVSKAAVKAWADIILKLFVEQEEILQIIIPIIKYTAGKNSDDGIREYCEPLVLEHALNLESDIISHVKDLMDGESEINDVALNRNVMVLKLGAKPDMLRLDIVDTDPEYKTGCNAIIDAAKHYNILKTGGGFHLYAKVDVDYVGPENETNEGWKLADKQWKMEFIRVTESETKGAITKHE